MADLYAKYEEWKGWSADQFFQIDSFESGYLPSHFKGIKLDGANLLELGFGNATKLAWAKSQGAKIYGTELNGELIRRAQKAGIIVLDPDLSKSIVHYRSKFDVIMAFDVFEHLDVDLIAQTLQSMNLLLKHGGFIVLRFPNGSSPFGRYLQNADHTHRSALSASIIKQLAAGTDLEIIREGIPFSTSGSLARRCKEIARYGLRRVVDGAIRRLYDLRGPLDTNLVLTLQRRIPT